MAEQEIRVRKGSGGRRVPMREAKRPDSWTRKKREVFLGHLAATCNVVASLRTVKMSSAGLYKMRHRDAHFRASWNEALEHGYARLEAELLDRALNGKRVTEVRGDTTVERIEHSDTLALSLLAQHRKAVAEFRAAAAVLGPREDTSVVRARIVQQIMTVAAALPDR